MNKQKVLKIVNSVMAADFILLAVTALSDDIIPKEIYQIVHPILGYAFLVCVLSHVYLNWNWIKTNILKKSVVQK